MNTVNTGFGLVLWFYFQFFGLFFFFFWLDCLFLFFFAVFFLVTMHNEIFSCDHDFIMGRKKNIHLSGLISCFWQFLINKQIQEYNAKSMHLSVSVGKIDLIQE